MYSQKIAKYWMPVDLYVGGPEHTVGHLLYSRFWTKVLFDAGLSPVNEPFKKLAHQGLILGPDGEKMSKSRGNVIPADEVAKDYGVDTLRCYVCFLGPMDKDKPWNSNGIDGVKRFLDRLNRLVMSDLTGQCHATDAALPIELEKTLHKTIKKVTEDIEAMSFNTCISQMMILVNELYKHDSKSKKALLPLVQLLQPFAPHTAEELWQKLGEQNLVVTAAWPAFKPELCTDDVVTLGVQVNGKMRGTIEIAITATEAEALSSAMGVAVIASALAGKVPTKIIYKAGKILNLIAPQ
jgi:leucyl-tRNA synthetase